MNLSSVSSSSQHEMIELQDLSKKDPNRVTTLKSRDLQPTPPTLPKLSTVSGGSTDSRLGGTPDLSSTTPKGFGKMKKGSHPELNLEQERMMARLFEAMESRADFGSALTLFSKDPKQLVAQAPALIEELTSEEPAVVKQGLQKLGVNPGKVHGLSMESSSLYDAIDGNFELDMDKSRSSGLRNDSGKDCYLHSALGFVTDLSNDEFTFALDRDPVKPEEKPKEEQDQEYRFRMRSYQEQRQFKENAGPELKKYIISKQEGGEGVDSRELRKGFFSGIPKSLQESEFPQSSPGRSARQGDAMAAVEHLLDGVGWEGPVVQKSITTEHDELGGETRHKKDPPSPVLQMGIDGCDSVQQALRGFTRPQLIDSENMVDLYGDQSGLKAQKATQQISLGSRPENLVIGLKRYDAEGLEKADKHRVTINPELTVESKDLESGRVKKAAYEPAQIICHDGDRLDGGHYVRFRKIDDQWYLYNDSQVGKVDMTDPKLKQWIEENAYVVHYAKTRELPDG